jgi:hypothetical protein
LNARRIRLRDWGENAGLRGASASDTPEHQTRLTGGIILLGADFLL